MAKKTTEAKGPKSAGTALANWQEEMEKAALAQVQSEDTAATSGGKFFSMKAGVLQIDDTPLPGNQMACIIVDSVMENVYYEEAYDAEQRSPPTCYAFGRDADTMQPHEEVDKHEEFTRQSDLCKNCIQNEWGSAARGKGKACSNRRRLAIIPAGTYSKAGKNGGFELDLFDDASLFANAELSYMKLPVMSVKGYAQYLKQVAEMLKKPTWAVFTRIYLEPDPKSQFRVKFELIEEVDEELLPVLYAKHNAAKGEIEFPYIPRSDDEDEAPAARQKAAKSNKKIARKKR
jgi:hypothetical protein